LFTIAQQIINISILLSPIIPNATKKVFEIMNIPHDKIYIENIKNIDVLNYDKKLNNLEILFTKIEDDN
jgi:methionyl-tRNA synthetase